MFYILLSIKNELNILSTKKLICKLICKLIINFISLQIVIL